MMIKLNYSDLKIGLIVIDDDNIVGTIIECNDIHNILVSYEKGGEGFYCLSPNCNENDNLYKK